MSGFDPVPNLTIRIRSPEYMKNYLLSGIVSTPDEPKLSMDYSTFYRNLVASLILNNSWFNDYISDFGNIIANREEFIIALQDLVECKGMILLNVLDTNTDIVELNRTSVPWNVTVR
jgi:hypothetical protein